MLKNIFEQRSFLACCCYAANRCLYEPTGPSQKKALLNQAYHIAFRYDIVDVSLDGKRSARRSCNLELRFLHHNFNEGRTLLHQPFIRGEPICDNALTIPLPQILWNQNFSIHTSQQIDRPPRAHEAVFANLVILRALRRQQTIVIHKFASFKPRLHRLSPWIDRHLRSCPHSACRTVQNAARMVSEYLDTSRGEARLLVSKYHAPLPLR